MSTPRTTTTTDRRRPPAARAARIGVAGASVAGFATLLAALPITAGAGDVTTAAVTAHDPSASATQAAPAPPTRRVVRILVRPDAATAAAPQWSGDASPSPRDASRGAPRDAIAPTPPARTHGS
jgi:hypothetical protein